MWADTAEAGWRWTLEQVGQDDGPLIPQSVPGDGPPVALPAAFRDGMWSGTGGLALTLAEVRLTRPWTEEEERLAASIADRLRRSLPSRTAADYFDGAVSDLGVLLALGEPGADVAVGRLAALATPDGWAQTGLTPPDYAAGARVNDVVLGTAGVLLGAVWAERQGVPGAGALAGTAAAVLMAEAENVPTGLDWPFVPHRFTAKTSRMPNFSHGLAGIAAALAVAGAQLRRPDLVDAARRGAEHLVSLADTGGGGFVVPRQIPNHRADMDDVTFNWCHGPAGTSLLFAALAHAGVDAVAGVAPDEWRRRCWRSVLGSGIPERLRPGFWDNDGRCCGTAGVLDLLLDAWQSGLWVDGRQDDESQDDEVFAFATRLADTLVERAVVTGSGADARVFWQFVEHRDPEPLLPPGVGWMQGAAGITAALFHAARVAEHGRDAPVVPRLDAWWAQA